MALALSIYIGGAVVWLIILGVGIGGGAKVSNAEIAMTTLLWPACLPLVIGAAIGVGK